MNQKSISLRQLSLHNGQDREEVWVAMDGLVYELTKSRLWLNGQHYGHWAGQELNKEIAEAPHTREVLSKFPVIGKLTNEQ